MTRYPGSRGLSVRMAACLLAVGFVYLALASWVSMVIVGWGSLLVSGAMPSPARALVATAVVTAVPLPFFPALAQARVLARLGAVPPSPDEAARVRPVVERLAAMADIPPPEVVVVPRGDANAFSTSAIGRSVVAVTRGLLRRLDDGELEAVLAHELAHVVNRDAFVMTLALLPAMLVRTAVWGVAGAVARRPAVALVGVVLLPFALFLALGWIAYAFVAMFATALSRTRELAADHTGAVLTGRPEALMSALQAIGGPSRAIPERDLRGAVVLDALAVLPTGGGGGWGLDPLRLFPTHPPLDDRLDRLAELARTLGHAGGPGPAARRPSQRPRPANPQARLALVLVLALYALSAWSVVTFEHSEVAFANEWALAVLACLGGGLVLGFQGVARASRGASGMAYAATALALLVAAPVLAFAAMLVVAATGSAP